MVILTLDPAPFAVRPAASVMVSVIACLMAFAALASTSARAADLAITVGPGRGLGPPPEIAEFDGGAWGAPRAPTPAQMGGGEGGRPARRVTGGPDYVGSSFGLGKPTFYGIGPRPDWGRSSTD